MFKLTDRQNYEFDLTGFLIIRNFLTKEVVAEINHQIDENLKGAWPRKFPFLHLSPIFMDLLSDERVLSMCQEWLGQWFRLDHAFGIQDPPAGSGHSPIQEDLHAGQFANQGVFRYNWFGNRPRCGVLVFVYYLEPVNRDDGGLVLVPGSHKSNYELGGGDVFHKLLNKSHDAWWIQNPPMNPGDMLVFTEAVIHGSKRWAPRDRRRRNLQYSYSPGFQASREPSQLEKYIPLARSDVERNLLRPPYVICESADDGLRFSPNSWRSSTIPKAH